MNHAFVRSASRRAGHVFTFAGERTTRGNFGNKYGAKLNASIVADMRRWAAREGWCLSRSAQADALRTRYSYVSKPTIFDVLSNASWRDTSYVPGRPDAEYWASLPPSVVVLRLMEVA
jgi:hypothetical protein